MSNYYVYVYIDPRNYEEFYYGKGKGNRKLAHLKDTSDSEKASRIREIQKEGLQPIIKVIAKELTENEAYLIEKTLIWKLGKTLTNKSSGRFADKFRPHNTLHLDLPYFDFQNGIFYINVGQGSNRNWEDCRKFGFLSAGQDPKFSDPLKTLSEGDVVVAYLKGHGYVGVGEIISSAVPVLDFRVNAHPLPKDQLVQPGIFENAGTPKSEYLVGVKWLRSVPMKQALWKSNANLFTSQLVKASLQTQQATLEFVQKGFDIDIMSLVE